MSAKRNWMMGCGIGCGLLIVIVLVLGGMTYFFIKDLARQAESLSERTSEMAAEFGPIEETQLVATDAVPPDRVERFLNVREALAEARADLEPRIERLAERKRDGRFGPLDLLALVKEAPRVAPSVLDYLANLTDILLAHEMSPGEYLYLYAVLYYSWLEHEPGDGPPFPLISSDDEQPPVWNRREEQVRRERTLLVREVLHDLLLQMMQLQLERAQSELIGSERWREVLDAEVERLRSEPMSLPWEEGLPEETLRAVNGYRTRLELNYSTLLNPIEVAIYDMD